MQIYTYLKRLGYTVTRADYPRPGRPRSPLQQVFRRSCFSQKLQRLVRSALSGISRFLAIMFKYLAETAWGPEMTALQRLHLVAEGKNRSLIAGDRCVTYGAPACRLQRMQKELILVTI